MTLLEMLQSYGQRAHSDALQRLLGQGGYQPFPGHTGPQGMHYGAMRPLWFPRGGGFGTQDRRPGPDDVAMFGENATVFRDYAPPPAQTVTGGGPMQGARPFLPTHIPFAWRIAGPQKGTGAGASWANGNAGRTTRSPGLF